MITFRWRGKFRQPRDIDYPARKNRDISALAIFGTEEEAISFANDEEVKERYGGGLDDDEGLELWVVDVYNPKKGHEGLKKKLGITQ